MERSLFQFIWQFSRRQQIITLALILVSFPFLYYSLDLPKTIVNEAIGGDGSATDFLEFQGQVFGTEIAFEGIRLGQVEYLLTLCAIFLSLVFVNGGFKLKINTFKGVMAERLLRRMRYMLLERSLRFPLPHFQKVSSGEVVTMVTAEVEPLGGFFGDAIALVAFQGGTFLTIMAFMFMQDPWLGLAAFVSIPVQGYIIPKLQRKVNLLAKERVKHVRDLSNRISEVITGVEEIHVQDHSKYTLADLSDRLGRIFWVRFEIYKRKFFMKFLNNFIGQMTPFFFYSVGGYLVIAGDLTLGALIAVLAAYKDLMPPWRELLNYYQRLADARIKYEQLQSQFVPEGMMPEEQFRDAPDEIPALDGPVKAASISYTDGDDLLVVDNATFTLEPKSTTLLTGTSGTGRDAVARLLTRLLRPTRGQIEVGGQRLDTLHEAVAGQRLGLLSATPAFFNASIAENIFLGIRQNVPHEDEDAVDSDRTEAIEEARAAGNSLANRYLDWTNYELAGATDYEDLRHKTVELLEQVELNEDLFQIGLRQRADPDRNPQLAEGVMQARRRIRSYLDSRGMDDLVRSYDFSAYNDYTTVAENILFGRPMTKELDLENIAYHPVIQELLDKHDLTDTFITIGRRCAETMVDMFRDIPPGHPFFEQFSFVDEDSLPEMTVLVGKANKAGLENLSKEEQCQFLTLPFQLTPQRHRLGLLDNRLQTKLVAVRRDLHENHPEMMGREILPFDQDRYNAELSIQENMLFGRIAYGRAEATDLVLGALVEITNELKLRETIIRTAFSFHVGIGGSRLTAAQRQKLALVRNLLKRPGLLVINDGLNSLDPDSRERIAGRLRRLAERATILWISDTTPPGLTYDQHLELHNGRIAVAGDKRTQAAADDEQQRAAMGDEARVLQSLPLFAELGANRLKFLAFTSERKQYKNGDVLFRQGEDGDAAFVILDGEAEVILEGGGHEENVLFTLGKNQLVGELALLCDTPRTATIRVVSDLTALKLNKEVFSELSRHDANFAYQMTRDMGQRLVKTTNELNATRDRQQ